MSEKTAYDPKLTFRQKLLYWRLRFRYWRVKWKMRIRALAND